MALHLQNNSASSAAVETAMWEVLSQPEDMPVWQWLEKHVVLTERETATPGSFKTDTRPYVREPLEGFRDKSVTDLVLCFGTQTAKTMTIMGGTAWKLCNDPMNLLWVMPNLDLARTFSTNRWRPFLEDCPPLRAQKPNDRHLYTTCGQTFSRATLKFVGSNSPANLASHPAGFIVMDETDKFKLRTAREAGALQNAEERSKSFHYPLRVKTSTPTTTDGVIWGEFLKGDQRYFHVPCPICQNMIRLNWKQIRWWDKDESESKTASGDWDLEKVIRNAFYRCQECDQKIYNHEKEAMLLKGDWKATNPNPLRGFRSYHLNSLYAPLKECHWGLLAAKWLQTKGSMTLRQNFINSTLAEPFDDERAVDDEPIPTTIYTTESLPEKRIPIMTIDVQEGHFWSVIRSWGHPNGPNGQESWLLFADRVDTPEELEKLQADYGVESQRVALDMAHRPNMVASLLVKNGWRGLWGQDRQGYPHTLGPGLRVVREYSPVQFRDPHLGTIHQNENNARAKYRYWCTDRIKDRLAALRGLNPPRWHVHAQVTRDYVHQMNSEKRVPKETRTGRLIYYWKAFRKANHLWDCECMQIVMALSGGVLEDDAMRAVNDQQQIFKLEASLDQNPITPASDQTGR